MYQENKNTFSWVQLILRCILVLLIVVLAMKLVSMFVEKKNVDNTKAYMKENLNQLMKVADDYFTEDILPKEIGDSKKITLKNLIDEKKISELKDADGNNCDLEESFIKATKLETEYQIKAYLVCGKENDYINEFIDIKKDDVIEIKPDKTTTTTTEKKKTTTTKRKTSTKTTKKTTTKVTTTTTTTKSNEFIVSFNTNGGNIVGNQKVSKNGKAKYIKPVRIGYKFVGWYYHGEEFDFDTKITQNYILVAKWTKE